MLPFSMLTASEIQKHLGLRCQELRLSRNLRRITLAEKAGVSVESIKRFETQGEVSLHNLVLLCLALNCTAEIETLFKSDTPQSIDEILQLQQSASKKRQRGKA
jgi:transcriptional regulator with XRE-family HTH domain